MRPVPLSCLNLQYPGSNCYGIGNCCLYWWELFYGLRSLVCDKVQNKCIVGDLTLYALLNIGWDVSFPILLSGEYGLDTARIGAVMLAADVPGLAAGMLLTTRR